MAGNGRCIIAGGGPAGMMAGFLLARAGIPVTVLEKHADFLRDFRGDTIHPSTLELMHELGLLDAFLKLPHQKAYELHGKVGSDELKIADFRHLPVAAPYVAFMPQWDFLDFLADEGRKYPTFDLRMSTPATDLIEENGAVVGLKTRGPDGDGELRGDLVIAADGRGSILRERAGLKVRDLGAPMDVLWFHMPRVASDPADVMGVFDAGRIVVLINRGDYWQCAFVIKKDSQAELRRLGLGAVQDALLKAAPFLGERVRGLDSWDKLKLLVVKVDRLERWHKPGLLCIGDAAHAMSPVGGVGINLAIQDAVATANILWRPLRDRRAAEADLAAVQKRRLLPTRIVQKMQVIVQTVVIAGLLGSAKPVRAPWYLRWATRLSLIQRIPARIVGLGVRPEHIRSPALPPVAAGSVDAPDWSSIPTPRDDGAAAHLLGMRLPALALQATNGETVDLSRLRGRTVVYAYPRTGQPGVDNPPGWDMIPGARGCTPQTCSFRDHFAELKTLGVDHLFGLSTQDPAYQREAAERLHLPFAILSDEHLALSRALALPLFETGGMTLLKRVTLVIRDGAIEHLFYPVFPPDRSAADVIAWLQGPGRNH